MFGEVTWSVWRGGRLNASMLPDDRVRSGRASARMQVRMYIVQ